MDTHVKEGQLYVQHQKFGKVSLIKKKKQLFLLVDGCCVDRNEEICCSDPLLNLCMTLSRHENDDNTVIYSMKLYNIKGNQQTYSMKLIKVTIISLYKSLSNVMVMLLVSLVQTQCKIFLGTLLK